METVNVKRELIGWALERSGLEVAELTKPFPKLAQWLAGDAQPTLRQLERLAKKTYTPIGYFFLPEPPVEELPIPDFRTVSDHMPVTPSPNLIDTLHTMERRQAWMHEFMIEQGEEPLAFVGSVRRTATPEAIAKRLRTALQLDDAWASHKGTWTDALRHLREAAEWIGVLVFVNGVVDNNTHRKLDPEEFRGFVLTDDYAPLVFVNGADAKSAQMFTLAHELAHLWLGQAGLFDLPNLDPGEEPVEQLCNRVAAEFLVPADALQERWREFRREDEPFQAVARFFKVSPIVAARRALDLGLVRRADFLSFFRAYQADERRRAAKTSGGNFFRNQNTRLGRRFGRAVVQAAREGHLLYRDAFHLTGLHGKTFDKYAKHVGALG